MLGLDQLSLLANVKAGKDYSSEIAPLSDVISEKVGLWDDFSEVQAQN